MTPNNLRSVGLAIVLLLAGTSCQQTPTSPEQQIANRMAKLAREKRASSYEAVGTALELFPPAFKMVRYSEFIRWDSARADSPVAVVMVDNVFHGGPEQEIRVKLKPGNCVTAAMMVKATGVASKPFEDKWTPSLLHPDHDSGPPVYNLTFTLSGDRRDSREVYLGGKADCYSEVVVQKRWEK